MKGKGSKRATKDSGNMPHKGGMGGKKGGMHGPMHPKVH